MKINDLIFSEVKMTESEMVTARLLKAPF